MTGIDRPKGDLMDSKEQTKTKFWPMSRTKKSLILFSAGLIVISLLHIAAS
jgi:hypothetical protein